MDTRDIIEIINLFSERQIKRLDISKGDFNLQLEKESHGINSNNLEFSEANNQRVEMIERNKAEIYQVKSILAGLYYEASSPGSEPFVKVGDHVEEGDPICIIEAMKMINEIKSPVSGIVKKINFKNEDLVQYDHVIMEIEEDV